MILERYVRLNAFTFVGRTLPKHAARVHRPVRRRGAGRAGRGGASGAELAVGPARFSKRLRLRRSHGSGAFGSLFPLRTLETIRWWKVSRQGPAAADAPSAVPWPWLPGSGALPLLGGPAGPRPWARRAGRWRPRSARCARPVHVAVGSFHVAARLSAPGRVRGWAVFAAGPSGPAWRQGRRRNAENGSDSSQAVNLLRSCWVVFPGRQSGKQKVPIVYPATHCRAAQVAVRKSLQGRWGREVTPDPSLPPVALPKTSNSVFKSAK